MDTVVRRPLSCRIELMSPCRVNLVQMLFGWVCVSWRGGWLEVCARGGLFLYVWMFTFLLGGEEKKHEAGVLTV